MKNKNIDGKTKQFSPLRFFTLFLGALFFVFFIFQATSVQAASLYLSPSTAERSIGQTFSITLGVASPDQSANAVDGVVSFPTDKLEVLSVSKSGSILNLWVQEPSFSNAKGTVNFEGIALNPGFKGSAGKIMSISFKTRSAGTAAISIASGSVLANDGQGTNITAGLGRATITIKGQTTEPVPVPESPSKPLAPPPTVSSSTHPDTNAWYNNNVADLSWSLASDVTAVSVFVDQNAATLPTAASDGLFKKYTTDALKSGVWYFHVRAKNAAGWGTAAHFKLQIDIDPPESVKIQFSDPVQIKNGQPVAVFDAVDPHSGVDHWEIVIDDVDAVVVNMNDLSDGSYVLPIKKSGLHKLSAATVDRAGNKTSASAEFTVIGLDKPTILQYPERLNAGDILAIKGKTANANALVKVFVQNYKDLVSETMVGTDENGEFYYFVEEKVHPGIYKLWVQIDDKEGKSSALSDKVTVVVQQTAWLAIAGREISVWLVVLPIVFLALFHLIFIMRMRRRSAGNRMNFRKNTSAFFRKK